MAMASMTLRPRTGLVSARPSVSARRAAPRVVSVKALGDTQLVISGTCACEWGCTSLGRAFSPTMYQQWHQIA